MDERAWRILILLIAVVAAWLLYGRRSRRGGSVCPRCGFSAAPGTPACPRCGRDLDTRQIELSRLEEARRRGELDEATYRRRKLRLIEGGRSDSGDRE